MELYLKIGWNYGYNYTFANFTMLGSPTYIFKDYPNIPIANIIEWESTSNYETSLGSITLKGTILQYFPNITEV